MMGSDDSDPDAEDDEVVVEGRQEAEAPGADHPAVLPGRHRGDPRPVPRVRGRRQATRPRPEKDGKGGYGWDEEKKEFRQDPKFTWRNPGFEQTDEHPVVNVSWNDAFAFCDG